MKWTFTILIIVFLTIISGCRKDEAAVETGTTTTAPLIETATSPVPTETTALSPTPAVASPTETATPAAGTPQPTKQPAQRATPAPAATAAPTATQAPTAAPTAASTATPVATPRTTPAPAKPASTRKPPPANLPRTHTVDHGGVKHAPGSDNPTQRCAACHGKELKGGKVAKTSCYGCHDKVW